MKLEDWLTPLVEDPRGTLPILRDWFLECGEDSCAWMCNWLYQRLLNFKRIPFWCFTSCHRIGPRTGKNLKGGATAWWFPNRPLPDFYQSDNGVPEPLFARLKGHKLLRDATMPCSEGTPVDAWRELWRACKLIALEELEAWVGQEAPA